MRDNVRKPPGRSWQTGLTVFIFLSGPYILWLVSIETMIFMAILLLIASRVSLCPIIIRPIPLLFMISMLSPGRNPNPNSRPQAIFPPTILCIFSFSPDFAIASGIRGCLCFIHAEQIPHPVLQHVKSIIRSYLGLQSLYLLVGKFHDLSASCTDKVIMMQAQHFYNSLILKA